MGSFPETKIDPRFFRLTPFCTFKKRTTNKVSIEIIRLTLFLLSQQVLFLCERRVISRDLEVLPSF